MFDPVDPKQSFPELEKGIQSYWEKERLFKRSQELRAGGEIFSFYDGPPFATGLPHYGHLLAGTIKDVIPRYQTMRGKFVERRFGWDCHGLPIENLVEKEHDLKSKKDIEAMGIDRFNELCRGSVQRYVKEWRSTVERMGRWVDMDWDYRTMDPDYMESIWWVFKSLWDKNLIYEGHKPMHVCPRCVTPLSNFEVTQGYKDVTDMTSTVMFKLKNLPTKKHHFGDCYALAWTTTTWTLPGNLLLAVNPHTTYVLVNIKFGSLENKNLLFAKDLMEKLINHDLVDKTKILEEIKGKDLIGVNYQPLFPYFEEEFKEIAFKIVAADFVTTEDGTGIVHIAPGFGDDDFQLGKEHDLPLLQHVTMDGHFVKQVSDFAGLEVKPAKDPRQTDQLLQKYLGEKQQLFKGESYKHPYPHCWRCDSPLLNYATSSWFVSVEKIKEAMLTANKQTEWVPAHLRDGRFGKWLEGARDWAISRNRYWGTPLPIWRCKDTGDVEVIGSQQELMDRHRVRFTKVTAVRHGESQANVAGVYQGTIPGADLTTLGRTQAEAAGKSLADSQVSIIYCSPLDRAKHTAEAIAEKTGARIIIDERLREIEFGEYEGKPYQSGLAAKRALMMQEGAPADRFHLAGMEEMGAVFGRTAMFLKEVLPKHRSEHVCVVTHGEVMRAIKHFFTQQEPLKITHQPMAGYAAPVTYFWDHDRESMLDLHKHIVDDVLWQGDGTEVDVQFVRHGETAWNKEGKVQGGDIDEPLNDTGKAQVKKLAEKMKGIRFDAIVASDLTRAKETAEILAKELGITEIEHTHLLAERKLGEWSGQQAKSLLSDLPSWLQSEYLSVAFDYRTPENGESLSSFLRRLQEAKENISKKYAGKRILVVAHRGVGQGLYTLTQNATYAEAQALPLPNGESMPMSFKTSFKRIPEVLDCWFESGSMPYAQSHFPFEYKHAAKPGSLPPGFPADFIAEGIDQTRGWFYTLTVLAAAIYGKPAFLNCVVNGTVLAEDGRKMSKRLKNYPDPSEVIEKYGADALRFTLMKSPAVRAEDLRFSEKTVEETLRSVVLPLWNCYSFFVTYANAAGFEAQPDRRTSSHPLDKYVKAEVQDLVNRMTAQLEAYDLSATCKELEETIDALTNWYIRLSRRRFAGKGSIDAESGADVNEEGQHEALSTLHSVLVTVSQLLAPFCPFLADAVYLNLVSEEHGSIHLTDWPEEKKLTKEEQGLLVRNRLLRLIVSLGLKVRSEKKVKTRQPLAKAVIAVPPSLLHGQTLSDEDLQLLRQELNVKEIDFADDPGSLGTTIVQVNARKVGPRLGGRVQEIIAAGKRGDFEIKDDGSILILDEALSPDEATVSYQGKEGQDIAAQGGVVVSIDTRVTDELKLEGRARDVIRAIQRLRKEAGFSITDNVTIAVEGADDILAAFRDLIAQETNVTFGKAEGARHSVESEDGSPVTIVLPA